MPKIWRCSLDCGRHQCQSWLGFKGAKKPCHESQVRGGPASCKILQGILDSETCPGFPCLSVLTLKFYQKSFCWIADNLLDCWKSDLLPFNICHLSCSAFWCLHIMSHYVYQISSNTRTLQFPFGTLPRRDNRSFASSWWSADRTSAATRCPSSPG